MPGLAVIEDGTVFRMVADGKLADSISCLQGKKDIFKSTPAGGCSSCARKRNAHRRDALNRIKTCLAGLSGEGREVLRKWLGAEQVRVLYTNSAGQVVQVNF